MANELLFRSITSVLVLITLPPLILLLKELLGQKATGRKSDTIELVLFIVYNTFLISGLLTLYINIQYIFFDAKPENYTTLALIRNMLKQIGIVLVSWKLYFITRGGDR